VRYLEIRLDENQAQYQQMLAGMVTNHIIPAETAATVVKSARTSLKRNDRIVWYLRWYRISETYDRVSRVLQDPKFQHRTDEMHKIFQRVTKTNFDAVNANDIRNFENYFQNPYSMEHLAYQLQIPSIDQMAWDINSPPQQIHRGLADLEAAHNASKKSVVSLKPGDKIILNYGKYAWVLLNRGACNDEADSMGHCGNLPSERPGDRILSFRSINGEQHRPHLTFILHRGGILGEMKGRANQKPNIKYHPYIIDLLKQDIVVSIEGGGYEPENNFDLSDLTDEQQQALLNEKPGLAGIMELYNTQGFDGVVRDAIERVLDNHKMHYESIRDNFVYIEDFKTLSDLFNEFDLTNMLEIEYAVDHQNEIQDGDEDESRIFYDIYLDHSDLENNMLEIDHWTEIIKLLPPDTINDLAEYLNTSPENSFDAFIEDDDLRDIYLESVRTGMITGTFDNMMKSLEEWRSINNSSVKVERTTYGGYRYSYGMPVADLVQTYPELSSGHSDSWSDIAPIKDIKSTITPNAIDYSTAASNLRYLFDHRILKKF